MTRRALLNLSAPLAWAAICTACESPNEPLPLHVPTRTIEAVGDAIQLSALGTEGQLPRWESLNPAIVTVTDAGMAVAVAPGTATVQAILGSHTAQGAVHVMDPVDVRVSQLRIRTDPSGTYDGMAMQLTNAGGRGYYRVQFWKEREAEGDDHRMILGFNTDLDAPVGMDIQFGTNMVTDPADWVVVFSREPRSIQYERTGCARLDGGSPCPIP